MKESGGITESNCLALMDETSIRRLPPILFLAQVCIKQLFNVSGGDFHMRLINCGTYVSRG